MVVAQGPYVVYVLRAGPMTCICITVLMLWPRLAHIMYVFSNLDTALYCDPHSLFCNLILHFCYFAFSLYEIAQVSTELCMSALGSVAASRSRALDSGREQLGIRCIGLIASLLSNYVCLLLELQW